VLDEAFGSVPEARPLLVPGQVAYSLAPQSPPGHVPYLYSIYSFAPSISTDGRLVAVLVENHGADRESLYDQDLIVKSTSGDKLVKRLPLSRASDEGDANPLITLKADDVAPLEPRYRARSEQTNAWLGRHGWRALEEVECESTGPPLSSNLLCATNHTSACVVEVLAQGPQEPGAPTPPRLRVRQRSGPVLAEVPGKSWPQHLADERCRTGRRTSVDGLWIDPAAGVLVAEIITSGDHQRCPPPMPDIHVVRLPPGACR
jgi:hypothetical protein